MEKRELVFMDAKSSKFWNIELQGNSHTVNYGRTGTNGQSKTKEFASADEAKNDFEKMVASKLKKGYVDAANEGVGGSESDQLPFIAFRSVKTQNDLYENVKTFVGKKVDDYDPDKKASADGKIAYRFRSDYDNDTLQPHLDHFCSTEAALAATAIVIGNWGGEDSQRKVDFVVETLVKNKDRLANLNAIFLGDTVSEENEMSWIQQSDVSPLLGAFPKLQVLRTRGGEGLELKKPEHATLRALAMESGGLPVEAVRAVGGSNLPNLEYLELWLGTDEYGGNSTVQDLQPILSGKQFPKLRYLGLRNCQYVNDIAAVVVNSPIIERIETLDLSLGTLVDEGAQALLALPDDGPLQNVNLHYNYASDDVIKKLKAHKITFDTSKPENMDEDEEWRFVAIGE